MSNACFLEFKTYQAFPLKGVKVFLESIVLTITLNLCCTCRELESHGHRDNSVILTLNKLHLFFDGKYIKATSVCSQSTYHLQGIRTALFCRPNTIFS